MTGMVEIPVQRLEQEEQELLRAQEVERQRVRRRVVKNMKMLRQGTGGNVSNLFSVHYIHSDSRT